MTTNKKFYLSFVFIALLSYGLMPKDNFSKQPASYKIKSNNDNFFNPTKNWGLNMGAGVNAYAAWKLSKGSPDIMVAVIDTGLDLSHPDLVDNLWKNPGETGLDAYGKQKSNNGKDDDGNGYIDDVNGWDFHKSTNVSDDTHGHGTHIAGIIAGKININKGIGGVAPKVKIAAYRYYVEADQPNVGQVNLDNTVKAIKLAIAHGANIINYSGGGASFSQEEYEAMKLAEAKGILIVAAAGNERSNSDLINHHYYPCAYSLSNVICVASVNQNHELLPSSNWGFKKVDVAAPGESIISTYPKNKSSYYPMTGTSQATAFVSGIAGLILSENPNLTPPEVKALISNTVDKYPTLTGKIYSGGVVNAEKALLQMNNKKMLVSNKKTQEVSEDPERKISSFKSLTPKQIKQMKKNSLKKLQDLVIDKEESLSDY